MISYSNREIEKLIDDMIHNSKYRDVLKDRFVDGLTLSEISLKRHFSDRQVCNIIYKYGDDILRKYSKLFPEND